MVGLIQFLLIITSLFLVVLILLQRGRGGGLAGALGGMGGQSAFGSKAGDVFTRITSGVAIVWIVLSVGALKYLHTSTDKFDPAAGSKATPAAEESIERDSSKAKTTPSNSGSTSPGGTKKSAPTEE